VPGVELRIASGATQYNEMAAWYAGIHVVVCASTTEGTPNPVLEAASCGRPHISTRVGIVPEMDGGGIIVERTPEAIRAAVLAYRDDPGRIKMDGQTAAAIAREDWDWRMKIGQYDRALEGVLCEEEATC